MQTLFVLSRPYRCKHESMLAMLLSNHDIYTYRDTLFNYFIEKRLLLLGSGYEGAQAALQEVYNKVLCKSLTLE